MENCEKDIQSASKDVLSLLLSTEKGPNTCQVQKNKSPAWIILMYKIIFSVTKSEVSEEDKVVMIWHAPQKWAAL